MEDKIEIFEIVVSLEETFGVSLSIPQRGPTIKDYRALRFAERLLKGLGGTLRETSESVMISPENLLAEIQALTSPGIRTFPVRVELFGTTLDFGAAEYWSQGMSIVDISPTCDELTAVARVSLRPINQEAVEWRLKDAVGSIT